MKGLTDINIQVEWINSSPKQNTWDAESGRTIIGGCRPCTNDEAQSQASDNVWLCCSMI